MSGRPVTQVIRLATALTMRRHALEIGWAVFALSTFAMLPLLGEWGTVPFHIVWVGITLLYGLRVWPLKPTWVLLAGLSAISAADLTWIAGKGAASWAEVSEVPLMAGMFLAIVWLARRHRAALDAALCSIERERDFVRDASHQLRTPISVARGHAELIRASHPAEPTRSDVEVVLDELERLSEMSHALLLLTTAELPGFLHLSDVDLERFLISACRRWTSSAKRRWILDVSVNGLVNLDEERMTSAVDALIENAIRHTRDNDAVSVTARADGTWVFIEVTDTGAGIKPDRLERIFERFVSFDGATQGHRRGTGLGLSIVKAIVEHHGGSITVSSPPGHGATFSIRIPGFRPFPTSPATNSRRRCRPGSRDGRGALE